MVVVSAYDNVLCNDVVLRFLSKHTKISNQRMAVSIILLGLRNSCRYSFSYPGFYKEKIKRITMLGEDKGTDDQNAEEAGLLCLCI